MYLVDYQRAAFIYLFQKKIVFNQTVLLHLTDNFNKLKLMELFYAYPENITEHEITLDAFETKHAIATLRKKTGDKIFVTDGLGKLYTTEVIAVKPSVLLQIRGQKTQPEPSPRIGLGVGYIRPNRLDFILEKGTELGINDFFLIRSEKANYMSTNQNRFDKVIRQALKQSIKLYKPILHFSHTLSEFFEQTSDYGLRIAATSSTDPPLLNAFQRNYKNHNSILIAIGPEGGFSRAEMNMLENNAFLCVSLGGSRLRSETAALSAVAAVQLFLNYLKEASLGTG